MAKKFVRGITDVKTINNQDFDTNNVNDLLSDGQYNYIHRKKGKNEEYHNLTDNIKTISSDNTDLLTVTNSNKTRNHATLSPKHDAQKEQVLESTRGTIAINHGTNGTAEKTTVDTNPEKVLEHENLHTSYGISKSTVGNAITLGLVYTNVEVGFDLNTLANGKVRGHDLVNAPKTTGWFYVSSYTEDSYCIQRATALVDTYNTSYVRRKDSGVWGEWREQVGDKSVIDALLAQKQDVLTAGDGITIQGNTISATGATSTIEYSYSDGRYQLFKYVVTDGYHKFITYTFNVNSGNPQLTFVGDLKNDLERFVRVDSTVSNGALKLTNDGTAIILINSKSTESGSQQGTFTFYDENPTGGGSAV